MRRTVAFLTAMGMSACHVQGPVSEDAASSEEDGATWPAPPTTLSLDVPRLFAGLPARVGLSGITPGADAMLAASKQRWGGGWCHPRLNGGCLDLAEPGWDLGNKASPASSTRFTVTMPEETVGHQVCLQGAAHVAGARLPTTLSDIVCLDVLDALLDTDADAIPDHADPFPDDADLPGRFSEPAILALEDTTLWSVDTDTLEMVALTSLFDADSSDPIVHHDIAIDRYGVVYATDGHRLYTCHPTTGACHAVSAWQDDGEGGTLGFGLAGWVGSTVTPSHDRLVATWPDGLAQHTLSADDMAGAYERSMDEWTPVGDAVQGVDGKLYLIGRDADDAGATPVLLEVLWDGIEERGTLPAGVDFTGLALWGEGLMAFAADGGIYHLDARSAEATFVEDAALPWSGAASKPNRP